MIDITKQYQTRDGRKVRLYADDAGGDHPIHGAILSWDGCRSTPDSWTTTGKNVWGMTGDSPLDLIPVPDWRDEIPWSAIKPEFRWVARHPDVRLWPDVGLWDGYTMEPARVAYGWNADGGRKALIGCAIAMPDGPDDWREAIAERPEGK